MLSLEPPVCGLVFGAHSTSGVSNEYISSSPCLQEDLTLEKKNLPEAACISRAGKHFMQHVTRYWINCKLVVIKWKLWEKYCWECRAEEHFIGLWILKTSLQSLQSLSSNRRKQCALWKDSVLAGSKRQAMTSHAPATVRHLEKITIATSLPATS